MLEKQIQTSDVDQELTAPKAKVRSCGTCEQHEFYITQDNRLICATCRLYVAGWHALGTTFAQ